MSAITYKPEAAKRGHEQVIDVDYEPGADPNYEQGADPDFDDTNQGDYTGGTDPDYDTDFRDPDAEQGSQEYRKRSQK